MEDQTFEDEGELEETDTNYELESETNDTDTLDEDGEPKNSDFLAKAKEITGREFKDEDDFKKHYKNLSSFVGKKIEPKERFFAPIIVRGEESEGIRFWGFGKTVYSELLAFISDPDYGDITDLENGRDITVEYKTAKETGTGYAGTEIRMKPNTSAAGDAKILDIMKEQKKIEDVFPVPTYEELDAMLQEYLNPIESEEEASDNEETKESNDKNETEHTAKSAKDINAQFSELFKKK